MKADMRQARRTETKVALIEWFITVSVEDGRARSVTLTTDA
jgi:hypothetical protein